MTPSNGDRPSLQRCSINSSLAASRSPWWDYAASAPRVWPSVNRSHRQIGRGQGSIRSMVVTRSIVRSKEATRPMPVLSAQATR